MASFFLLLGLLTGKRDSNYIDRRQQLRSLDGAGLLSPERSSCSRAVFIEFAVWAVLLPLFGLRRSFRNDREKEFSFPV
jgi:hypothetical protein